MLANLMIVTMLGPNLLFVFFDLDFEVTKEGSQDLTEASKPITNSLFSLGKTPVNLVHLKNELKSYPDKAVAEELAHGFEFGFPLYYTGSRMPKESKKLKTANEIDQHKLLTEINLGRIAGPFHDKPISTLRISPIGLVEKKTPGFFDCSAKLGIPIATRKNEGPKTKITFLGLEIDSIDMVVRMPMEKVKQIISKIQSVKATKKTTL